MDWVSFGDDGVGVESGNLQEADFVDCFVEPFCEPLFAAWSVELGEVEGYEVGPVYCCNGVSTALALMPLNAATDAQIWILLVGGRLADHARPGSALFVSLWPL